MAINLRLSLTVFKLGFAAESASGFIALASASHQLPFHGIIILLGPVITAIGILFLYLGRHEWNELHRTRVRYANVAFGGPKRNHLFMCASQSLYLLQVQTQGAAPG